VANDPPGDPGLPLGDHDTEPDEPQMKGDFDSGADDLWILYGKAAKEFDESHIQTVKEEMNDVFLFVRLYLYHAHNRLGYTDTLFPTGCLILRHRHRVHNRQQAELKGQPCRANGLLPSTTFLTPCSDFPANLLHRSPGLNPLPYTAPFPFFQPISIRHLHKLLFVFCPPIKSLCSTLRASHSTVCS
jgi:hypothetical protein